LSATLRIAAGGLLLALLTGCASLPASVERMPSHALSDTAATTGLGRALAPLVSAHAGLTGAHPLRDGREAFAARALLAAAAERTLDVQYYIWRKDISGRLMAHALWQAAERGVRVRMLLDDANTGGLDSFLAELDAHPNIEVRLFNPFANRSFRVGDFAGDFARVNRRMHNKMFIADNQAAVLGGRNIGDEYLGAEVAVEFADLDVVATGAVLPEISASFDDYWNSTVTYPLASMVPAVPPGSGREAAQAWATLQQSPEAQAYVEAVRASVSIPQMLSGGQLEWVAARLVADAPEKVLHPPGALQMLPHLQESLGAPEQELLLVSPYFVPTRQGTDALVAIAARGVRVSVLTNSLASTDVTPTYSGYARYRRDLLRGGVRLFELKPASVPHVREPGERRKFGGSSGASLHAKTFAVDRRRIFVGSFNLDPRSASLNTECGLVLESPAFASRLSEVFQAEVPLRAYEVRLDPATQEMVWVERTDGVEVRHTHSPGTSAMRRAWAGFLGWLPIEWLL
jgi:putative cardiolipin synthase